MVDVTPTEMVVAGSVGMLLAGVWLWSLHAGVAALSQARRPALALAVGGLGRWLLAAATFYLLARYAGTPGLLAALLGFALARTLILARLTR